MTKFALRSLAGIALASVPFTANAAQITATMSANIVKPVQLTKIQDMDYGTLLVSNYTGTRNVVMTRAGAVSCPVEITCSGAPKQARFNVQGTNKMVVGITVTSGGLVNGSNTIPFTAGRPQQYHNDQLWRSGHRRRYRRDANRQRVHSRRALYRHADHHRRLPIGIGFPAIAKAPLRRGFFVGADVGGRP